MRLIDADALIEEARELHIDDFMIVFGMANKQPTAYDVEKVVEKLHEFSLNTEPYCNEMMREGVCSDFTDCDYCKLQYAIDIVKRGGVE